MHQPNQTGAFSRVTLIVINPQTERHPIAAYPCHLSQKAHTHTYVERDGGRGGEGRLVLSFSNNVAFSLWQMYEGIRNPKWALNGSRVYNARSLEIGAEITTGLKCGTTRQKFEKEKGDDRPEVEKKKQTQTFV
jgi:hypothetical protein